MTVSKVVAPVLGKRGSVSIYGYVELRDEAGTSLILRIDAKRGQKWNKLHDALLVDLADILKTGIIEG